MKRPAFLSGFLMMLVGLGLTIAVMFVLPFHKDAAAPCFHLVRMTAVLGFASALAGVMLQFSSAGLAAGIQLMNMLLGIVITLAAAFVIGPCAVENAPFFQNCRISPAAPIRAPKPLCTTHERTNE